MTESIPCLCGCGVDATWTNTATSQHPVSLASLQAAHDSLFPPMFEKPMDFMRRGRKFLVVFGSSRVRRVYRKAAREYGIRGPMMDTLLRCTKVRPIIEPGNFYFINLDAWKDFGGML